MKYIDDTCKANEAHAPIPSSAIHDAAAENSLL